MSKSLFSKEEKSSFEVAKTGGDVDVIVSQLIIHAHDKDDTVRLSLTLALNELGTKQPVLMVSTLTAFCLKNPKLDQGHRVQLLKVMTTVLESSRDLIPEPLATDVIAFASREMTGSDDVIADLQGPASTVLTLLSVPYPNIVIDRLLSLFKAGEVPHYYVVKTFADVAVANGVAFTLRLRDVLTRMTPVLGNIKKSPMKWVFAAAFGRFAEAMSHFQANADDTAKLQVQPAHFELDMGSAFDVMSTKWLDDKEPKVRFGVIESLGFMAGTINRQDFEVKWLPRLVPTYINMYKKEKPSDYLPISHGFCQLMTEAVRNDSQCIVPLLPIILAGIHPLVCRPPSDFQNQTAMKNHGELLRCFEILGRAQLEQVLHFVINRFQLKESMTRIGSLVILRHYVNSMDAILEDKKPLIMSSVNTLIGETDLTVKKSIMQLIVSMSNQGYLTMEGGQSLVRFIIQQCAIPVDDHADADVKNPNITTPLQIRNAGNHILQVMATKQVNMRSVLWPYMLELIIDPEYSPAIVIIFKCIEHIGTAKRAENAPDYKINFEAQVNIPHAQHFLCRLMILASEPFRKKDMGMTMCRAMLALGPIIHEKIGTFWDETVPSLITYLESNPDEDLNISKWQDSLLKLWRETLALIDQPKWLHDLVTCLCDHFKLHKKDPALHRVIQRYMGALLARIEAKTIITSTLELMFNTANHSNDVERQGVAQGYGLCASAHLDTVLPKLTERLEPAEKKKSGFFSSFGNKKEDDVDDTIKATVMLCYGYVAAYANPELIISRLDVHILHNLIPAMNKAKTVMLKVNVIKAIDLVGKAVHVSRLPENKKNHKLSQRDDLMNGLISYLDDKVQKIHKPNSEIRLLGLNAASTLANLEPPVSSAVRTKLFAAVLPYYSLYLTRGASSSLVSAPSSPSHAEEKQPASPTAEEDSNVTEMIYANLNTLLSSILHMEPTVPSLIDMLKLIEEYVSSAKVLERERSCTSCLVLLKKFVSKCVHEKTPQDAKLIPELGHHLGVFLPRVTDADLTIRQTATENIQALLYINQILENPDNPKPVQEIKLITEIRNRLECESMEDRLAIIRDLASLLSAVVNTTEQIRLLITLFLGLNDPDADGALGAAEMFKGLIERKGSEMISEIRPLVSGMIAALKLIKRDAVQSTALATMRTLTKIHFIPIITQLLETPTPLPREVIDCFISLVDSEDVELANQTILHLYNTINETPMDKDKPTPVVMTATAALRELIPIPRIHTLITEQYAAILCTILMRIGTASGVDKGVSSKDAVATLKTFFTTMQEDAIIARMDEEKVWEELEGKVYDDGITTVTKIISTIHPANKRPLLSFLAKFYSQQSYVGQRTVATAMLAEFVNHSQDDQNLLKELIKFLLPRVADKVEKVRKQALRGLGNLVSVWSDTINEMATSILSALTAAAEDTDAEVAAEAVQSLTRIVGVVNEETIGPMLISICFRVRPAFDRKDIDVRARSFLLFGALCRFGISSAMDEGHLSNFIDQVHSNIPIFIVHMNDDEQKVRSATHDGFKLLSKLCPQEIQTVIEEAIPEPHGYDELVNKLTPLLTATYADRVRGYIETSLSYFTSKWTVIRGNAAIFTALIVAHATENMRKTININTCVQALIKLLEEPTPLVRSRAAKSLSLLYDV